MNNKTDNTTENIYRHKKILFVLVVNPTTYEIVRPLENNLLLVLNFSTPKRRLHYVKKVQCV